MGLDPARNMSTQTVPQSEMIRLEEGVATVTVRCRGAAVVTTAMTMTTDNEEEEEEEELDEEELRAAAAAADDDAPPRARATVLPTFRAFSSPTSSSSWEASAAVAESAEEEAGRGVPAVSHDDEDLDEDEGLLESAAARFPARVSKAVSMELSLVEPSSKRARVPVYSRFDDTTRHLASAPKRTKETPARTKPVRRAVPRVSGRHETRARLSSRAPSGT